MRDVLAYNNLVALQMLVEEYKTSVSDLQQLLYRLEGCSQNTIIVFLKYAVRELGVQSVAQAICTRLSLSRNEPTIIRFLLDGGAQLHLYPKYIARMIVEYPEIGYQILNRIQDVGDLSSALAASYLEIAEYHGVVNIAEYLLGLGVNPVFGLKSLLLRGGPYLSARLNRYKEYPELVKVLSCHQNYGELWIKEIGGPLHEYDRWYSRNPFYRQVELLNTYSPLLLCLAVGDLSWFNGERIKLLPSLVLQTSPRLALKLIKRSQDPLNPLIWIKEAIKFSSSTSNAIVKYFRAQLTETELTYLLTLSIASDNLSVARILLNAGGSLDLLKETRLQRSALLTRLLTLEIAANNLPAARLLLSAGGNVELLEETRIQRQALLEALGVAEPAAEEPKRKPTRQERRRREKERRRERQDKNTPPEFILEQMEKNYKLTGGQINYYEHDDSDGECGYESDY